MTMTGFEAQWQNLPGCACVPAAEQHAPRPHEGRRAKPTPGGNPQAGAGRKGRAPRLAGEGWPCAGELRPLVAWGAAVSRLRSAGRAEVSGVPRCRYAGLVCGEKQTFRAPPGDNSRSPLGP